MADRVFPERPFLPRPQPVAAELIVRREPLIAIQEVLSISIHDVVNERRCKRRVADLYQITRKIENEAWLRRQLRAEDERAWIASHL